MFYKLNSLLTKRDKQFLLGLFFFSIIISIIETAGIALIMPFISLATDFSLIHSQKYYQVFFDFFSFEKEINFVITFGIILIFFYIFRSGINFLYFHMLARFTQGRYHLLAYRLFENYMGMPYQEFVKKNSSTLTKSIVNEAANLTQLISSVLFMMSELFIVLFIYGMMLWVNYKITLLLTAILIINAIFMLKTVSIKIKKAGSKRADLQKTFYEIINRSFGNFKLFKLHSNEKEIMQEFARASYGFANANITNATLSHFPRLFLEAISFGLIIFIVTYLVWKYENDISALLSMISMFILALYRLMPSVNRIMSSYNQILFNKKALSIVHNDLMYNSEELGEVKITFESHLKLQDISFEYNDGNPVLQRLNLNIHKGEKVAFIGESGSGKSTLVDLIMGLYKPKEGFIEIDGVVLEDMNIKSWRNKIGYIPQSIYLFDATVGENVAFEKEIDKQKVDICLKKAKIYDFLQSKEGQDTLVGEGGVMLSGGQKQRIAIARALYTDPEILVLDEATSALDTETEKQIMNEIYAISKERTLLVIAHRLSTVDQCDRIYHIKNGRFLDE